MSTPDLDAAWDWLRAGGLDLRPRFGPEGDALVSLYLPLLGPVPAHRPFVIGHLAQSLDGRIALPDGESQWITGDADLVHTHRLRALVDAVLVGACTIAADDPQLTVRRVPGDNPLRVVLDPSGRLNRSHRVFADGAPTLRITRGATPSSSAAPGAALDTDLVVEDEDGFLPPARLLGALRARGIRRLLVEGGGVTLGHFVAAGVVDRLHVTVAPMLLGGGRSSMPVPLGGALARCPRPITRVIPLGSDWLFDCAL